MAKQITRWRLDTCGCVIDQEWDRTGPAARLLAMQAQTTCAAHGGLAPEDVGTICLAENQRKNRALAAVRAALAFAEDDPDPAWTFDAGRRLRLILPAGGDRGAARAAIQSALGLDAAQIDVV